MSVNTANSQNSSYGLSPDKAQELIEQTKNRQRQERAQRLAGINVRTTAQPVRDRFSNLAKSLGEHAKEGMTQVIDRSSALMRKTGIPIGRLPIQSAIETQSTETPTPPDVPTETKETSIQFKSKIQILKRIAFIKNTIFEKDDQQRLLKQIETIEARLAMEERTNIIVINRSQIEKSLETETQPILMAIIESVYKAFEKQFKLSMQCQLLGELGKANKKTAKFLEQSAHIIDLIKDPIKAAQGNPETIYKTLSSTAEISTDLQEYNDKVLKTVKVDLQVKELEIAKIENFTHLDDSLSTQAHALRLRSAETPEEQLALLEEVEKFDEAFSQIMITKHDEGLIVIDQIFLPQSQESIIGDDPKRTTALRQLSVNLTNGKTRYSAKTYISSDAIKITAKNFSRLKDYMKILNELINQARNHTQQLSELLTNIPDSTVIKGEKVSKMREAITEAEVLTSSDQITSPNEALAINKINKKLESCIAKVVEDRTTSFDTRLLKMLKDYLPELSDEQLTILGELETKLFTNAEKILEASEYSKAKEDYEKLTTGHEKMSFLKNNLAKLIEVQAEIENPEIQDLRTRITQNSKMSAQELKAKFPEFDMNKPEQALAARNMLLDPLKAELQEKLEKTKTSPRAKAFAAFDLSKQGLDKLYSDYEASNKGVLEECKQKSRTLAKAMQQARSEERNFEIIAKNHEALAKAISEFSALTKKICNEDPEKLKSIEVKLDEMLNPQAAEQMLAKYIQEIYSLQETHGQIPQNRWKVLYAGVQKLWQNNLIHDPQVMLAAHYIINCSPNTASKVPSQSTLKTIYFASGEWARLQRQVQNIHNGILRGRMNNLSQSGTISYLLNSKLNINLGANVRVKADGTVLSSRPEIALDDLETSISATKRKIEGCQRNLDAANAAKSERKIQKFENKLTDYKGKLAKFETRKHELEAKKMETTKGAKQQGDRLTSRGKLVDIYLHPSKFIGENLENIPLLRRLPRFEKGPSESFAKRRQEQSVGVKDVLAGTYRGAKEVVVGTVKAPIKVVTVTASAASVVKDKTVEVFSSAARERKRTKRLRLVQRDTSNKVANIMNLAEYRKINLSPANNNNYPQIDNDLVSAAS